MNLLSTDLIWDKYIYPRNKKSDVTIKAYQEAMGIGAEFPPIEAQRVSGYQNGKGELIETYIIIDGVHRWHSYQECKVEEVDVIEWRPGETLDYESHKIELGLEASERNTRHGDRLGEGDKKAKARQIANDDLERKWTEEAIAKKLRVNRQRVNEWISDIRTRQQASRDSMVFRLSRLGWTQGEMAEVTGISQNRVSEIIDNAEFGIIDNLLAEGQTMDYIANHLHMDLALVWALRLDDKEDLYRFNGGIPTKEGKQELGWGLRTWDSWYFGKCDERFGDDWPGRIPAQLVAHTLYYFTKQGDLVLDPMAGGGVVPDTCLAFERKCRAFDLKTRSERPEIQEHYWDASDMKWPECLLSGYGKKPDLIFFDPPYYTKKEDEYKEIAGDEVVPISSLSKADYLDFFRKFFVLAHEHSKPTTRIAFLNADWRDFQSTPAYEEDPDNMVSVFDYEKQLSTTGWQVTHVIDANMSTERFSGQMVKSMQELKELGTVRRTLLIARKS
jgi:plasmid maintenance system antidote protein VapI